MHADPLYYVLEFSEKPPHCPTLKFRLLHKRGHHPTQISPEILEIDASISEPRRAGRGHRQSILKRSRFSPQGVGKGSTE
jgi:hypothetical protein